MLGGVVGRHVCQSGASIEFSTHCARLAAQRARNQRTAPWMLQPTKMPNNPIVSCLAGLKYLVINTWLTTTKRINRKYTFPTHFYFLQLNLTINKIMKYNQLAFLNKIRTVWFLYNDTWFVSKVNVTLPKIFTQIRTSNMWLAIVKLGPGLGNSHYPVELVNCCLAC